MTSPIHGSAGPLPAFDPVPNTALAVNPAPAPTPAEKIARTLSLLPSKADDASEQVLSRQQRSSPGSVEGGFEEKWQPIHPHQTLPSRMPEVLERFQKWMQDEEMRKTEMQKQKMLETNTVQGGNFRESAHRT